MRVMMNKVMMSGQKMLLFYLSSQTFRLQPFESEFLGTHVVTWIYLGAIFSPFGSFTCGPRMPPFSLSSQFSHGPVRTATQATGGSSQYDSIRPLPSSLPMLLLHYMAAVLYAFGNAMLSAYSASCLYSAYRHTHRDIHTQGHTGTHRETSTHPALEIIVTFSVRSDFPLLHYDVILLVLFNIKKFLLDPCCVFVQRFHS